MTRSPHPDLRPVLDAIRNGEYPPLRALSPANARELAEELSPDPDEPTPVESVRDFRIPGPAGELPVRTYRPGNRDPAPAIVYLHGGGWVTGSVETCDEVCRTLANEAESVVVSVEYRRAPEHPFPEPLLDSYAAVEWVAEHADRLGVDDDRLAVGGDSAGGNLAAATSLLARDRDADFDLAYQFLVYPLVDYPFEAGAPGDSEAESLLTEADVEWYWDNYLARPLDGHHPYAAPSRTRDLSGLPPATVLTAEFDPVRDEAVRYADRLEEAGVAVTHRHYDRMIHGFVEMLVEPDLEQARDALGALADDFHASFDA